MTDPALFALLLLAAQDAGSAQLRHPHIPCWNGVRTWTAPGQSPSDTAAYDTRGDIQPYLVTHNRDQIRRGAELVQDYNFIDYWFGDPANPIRARYYLRNDESVGVILPGDAGQRLTMTEVRERFPPDVLCYLQRRFDRIEVLLADGYRELWTRPQ